MRFIPTKLHGVLDYLVGLLLIVAPWVFNFSNGGTKTWLPVALGIAAVVYSFFTNYEMGIIKLIPFNFHLSLDFASGLLLALSPWIFGFKDEVYAPHLIFGLFEIAASLLTEKYPLQGTLPTFQTGKSHASN